VLQEGLPRLEEALDRAAASTGVVPGDVAFRLYDTHGPPLDFITDMIEDRKLTLDLEGFERSMEAHWAKARAKSAFRASAHEDWQAVSDTRASLEAIGEQIFRGYTETTVNTTVAALFDASHQQTDRLAAGQEGFVALVET